MDNLIKQVDYHDRHNTGKKKWALKYEEIEKREIDELLKESEQLTKNTK